MARKGYYSTHPNPRVGCVIVRNGLQVAAGFHEYAGGPHAEVNALSQLDGNADGCTLYVTLEPCSHIGKTPPCVDAIIAANPKCVVIAMNDPNPLVAGKGVEKLKQAGIEVISGVQGKQSQELNTGFIKRMSRQSPFVRVKMASTLDGRIALKNGLSQWITGEDSRQDVQFLRAGSSAVLSTAETVLADNAALNVRLTREQLNQQITVRQPTRVILDSQRRLTGKERLFESEGEIRIFTSQSQKAHNNRFKQPNVHIHVLPENEDGQLDLAQLMDKLVRLEINELHTECGAGLAGALLKMELVDELVIYLAPSLLGNQAKGLFDLDEISIMSDRIQLSIRDVRAIGNDIRIRANIDAH